MKTAPDNHTGCKRRTDTRTFKPLLTELAEDRRPLELLLGHDGGALGKDLAEIENVKGRLVVANDDGRLGLAVVSGEQLLNVLLALDLAGDADKGATDLIK